MNQESSSYTGRPFTKPPRQADDFRLRNAIRVYAHMLSLKQLCERFETNSVSGVSHPTARKKLDRDGLNEFSQSTSQEFTTKFLKYLRTKFSILLWIGSILCFAAHVFKSEDGYPDDNLYIGILLVVIILIIASSSYYHEQRSREITKSHQDMIPQYVSVIRGGKRMRINSTLLVVGDLIELGPGDRVPADMIIIESRGHKVDNSALTGDIIPQAGSAEYTSFDPLLTENLAFGGTSFVEGRAKGIIIAIGKRTVMGRLKKYATEPLPQDSVIDIEVHHFIMIMTIFAVIPAVIFFTITMLMGYNWLKSLIFLIAIIVSNVPEGLSITVEACLTSIARRMLTKNCLIKSLDAIGTLGSISVICTDKTGILTQNQLLVSHLWYDDDTHGVDPQNEEPQETSNTAYKALTTAAVLCSQAEYFPGQEKMPKAYKKISGNLIDTALLGFVDNELDNFMEIRKQYPKVAEIPFDSVNKFHLSVHLKEGQFLAVMKGAPEIIITHCSTTYLDGKEVKLTEDLLEGIDMVIEELASMGELVLGFCDHRLPSERYPSNYSFENEGINAVLREKFRLIGLISMLDPTRINVPDAMSKCHSSGIKLIMVTGDHPTTAKVIAKKIGVIQQETVEDIAERLDISVEDVSPEDAHAIVVHGNDLDEMGATALDDFLRTHTEIVVARAVPKHRMRIIEACQRQGSAVAVIGRGVNDVPSLRLADIGVALAVNGTDIARDSSSVILLDDNFATFVAGIEEGRLLFENLKKSIAYTLMSNMAKVFPLFAFILWDIPLPLGVVTIFCIDLGIEMMPPMSLAFEMPETDLTNGPPRDADQNLLVNEQMMSLTYGQIGFIHVLGGFFAYFVVMGENGFLPGKLFGLRAKWYSKAINDLEDSYGQEWTYRERRILEYHCHTAFFISMVVLQWADLIICKTRRSSIFDHGMQNLALNFSLVFETLLAIFLCYGAGMQKALKMYPIRIRYWFVALPFSVLIFVYDEMRKYLIRRYPGGWVERETYY